MEIERQNNKNNKQGKINKKMKKKRNQINLWPLKMILSKKIKSVVMAILKNKEQKTKWAN